MKQTNTKRGTLEDEKRLEEEAFVAGHDRYKLATIRSLSGL